MTFNPWNRKENLENWKRRYTYNKYPIWFWKILCKLKICHNDLLIEFHNIHPITKKDLGRNCYGVYECVYCLRKRKEK